MHCRPEIDFHLQGSEFSLRYATSRYEILQRLPTLLHETFSKFSLVSRHTGEYLTCASLGQTLQTTAASHAKFVFFGRWSLLEASVMSNVRSGRSVAELCQHFLLRH